MSTNNLDHLLDEYNFLYSMVETTENFIEELRIKYKQLIIQKSKLGSVIEDLAGVISRYCKHNEHQFRFGSEQNNMHSDNADPLGVFIVNLSHFSNCFLISNDCFNDNCMRLETIFREKLRNMKLGIRSFKQGCLSELKHLVKNAIKKEKKLKKMTFLDASSITKPKNRLSDNENKDESLNCLTEIEQVANLKKAFEDGYIMTLKELFLEFLQIELSFNLQSLRIQQNAFIGLNSRLKSNRTLLERDLNLFKIRPTMHSSRPRTIKDYEYDVGHLTNVGFYLPDKPPNKHTNGQPIPNMNIIEPINTKTIITDNIKAEKKDLSFFKSSFNETKVSPKLNENFNINSSLNQTTKLLNANIKNDLKIIIPNSDNRNKVVSFLTDTKNENGSSLLMSANLPVTSHTPQIDTRFKTELDNEIKRRYSSFNITHNRNKNNNNNNDHIGGHYDQLSFTSLSSLSDTNESVEAVISKPKIKFDYIYPIEYTSTVHYIDENMDRSFFN